ncbi:MAG: hypothetical protein HY611_05485 [Elusimicrobia bacterium]|nr:hypothetical protein [Elusimicrobiota bacterium]
MRYLIKLFVLSSFLCLQTISLWAIKTYGDSDPRTHWSANIDSILEDARKEESTRLKVQFLEVTGKAAVAVTNAYDAVTQLKSGCKELPCESEIRGVIRSVNALAAAIQETDAVSRRMLWEGYIAGFSEEDQQMARLTYLNLFRSMPSRMKLSPQAMQALPAELQRQIEAAGEKLQISVRSFVETVCQFYGEEFIKDLER